MTSRFAKSATTAKRFVILTLLVTGGTQCWIAHKQLARSAKTTWMIDMNIKEAVERIEMLNKNITEQVNVASIIRREKIKEVWVNFSPTEYGGSRYIAINQEIFLEMIVFNTQQNEAERNKLQPIVDMADAALKGVLS